MPGDDLKELQEFLSSETGISSEDKKFAFNFYKKCFYLNELNEMVINKCVDKPFIGYGNYNAKIAIVIRSAEHLNKVVSVIQPVMASINISMWNVYVTVLNKDECDDRFNIETLLNEINAVGPQLLYVIDESSTICSDISNSIARFPKFKDMVVKSINIDDIMFIADPKNKTEKESEWLSKRNTVWLSLRHMINFKDQEVIE